MNRSQTTDSALRVGYVLKMFPRLSETFILNELLELERQGVTASVFSLKHPDDGRFHPQLAELTLAARYYPSQKPELWWNVVHELPASLATPPERWDEAVRLLRRHAVPRDLEFLLRALVIAAHVREAGVEHLHAHFATVATRMAAVVAQLAGVSFSFTAHAKDIFRATVDRTLFAELVERSAFCVTVSEFNREYILAHTPGVDPAKVVTLYNGVDLTRLRPRKREGGPPRLPHVVSVGRLVPKKGFDHLLRALSLCKANGLPCRATIVGGGTEHDALLRLRDELGLRDEVTFTGALGHDRVIEILHSADLVALACVPDQDGNMDALPTVLLEALALDLPLVSTSLTGVPEIVEPGTGLLTAPGDAAAMAAAIETVWGELRDGGREPGACREVCLRKFDLARNVGRLRGMFVERAGLEVPA